MNLLATSQTLLAAGWSNGQHGGGWFWPLIPLLWITVFATVAWLVLRRRPPAASGLSRAREVLAERYARGEVSSDEYHERLANLE